MEKSEILKIILSDKYYSLDDLRYNQKLGFMFSKDKLAEFLTGKDDLIANNYEKIIILPLKTFNSKHCFYVKGPYLLYNYKEYLSTIIEDYKVNKSTLFIRNIDDIMMSRVFSEIEGSLNVENIATTHRRIKEIYAKEKLTEKNDIIVKNMMNAIGYIIKECPTFNKDNLFKLYNILSNDCLDDEDKLPKGAYYRNEPVSVGNFDGADHTIISECMDSLFDFVNNEENQRNYSDLLQHICHYYILYVHPYFDYNGRTARMVSFWLNCICKNTDSAALFMSEAISENKYEYYKAISNTRLMNNDLTYFLGYVLETSTKFNLIYKNLENIKNTLMQTGDTLTSTEWVYFKKILIHNNDGFFTYKMFLEYIGGTMSRQGALKILNHLANYNIIEKSTNRKNETIYKVNQELIVYKYQR